MSRVEERLWSAGESGRSRADRQPCKYKVYIPDTLVGRAFLFDGVVAADVTDAEAAITKFNSEASALVSTEALARILLRAESLASSRIEGLEMGARKILRAEVELRGKDAHVDLSAREILANIQAMDYAIGGVAKGDPITLEHLLKINQQLLESTSLSSQGGQLRAIQNWIGKGSFNPCSADFVPPNWELVPELMADLVEFCNQDDLPAVAQAAIAHAQFETIHPFVDGNGRTGRVLIQMILHRRGLSPKIVPPVSLILATWADEYIGGLTAMRYVGQADSQQARDGINLWVGRFAAASSRAVKDASEFEVRASEIEKKWRTTLGAIRKGSSTDILLRGLVGAPVLTVATAMALTGTTHKATNEAIAILVQAGILKPISAALRNRSFEAPEIIKAFGDLERQLASPEGDTKISTPTRKVPYRRK